MKHKQVIGCEDLQFSRKPLSRESCSVTPSLCFFHLVAMVTLSALHRHGALLKIPPFLVSYYSCDLFHCKNVCSPDFRVYVSVLTFEK